MSRPERLPWLVAGAGALGALGYAAAIEPYALRVVHLEMRAPRLPPAFDGYTICQVSDLHTRQMGRRERALRSLMATLPPIDLVAITGDLIHTPRGVVPFLELAGSFAARDGLYAIFGNSEHKNGVRPHAFAETLAAHNISPLLNRHVLLTRGDAHIVLAGVDDPVNDKDDLSAALRGVPDDVFTLLLMHSPGRHRRGGPARGGRGAVGPHARRTGQAPLLRRAVDPHPAGTAHERRATTRAAACAAPSASDRAAPSSTSRAAWASAASPCASSPPPN